MKLTCCLLSSTKIRNEWSHVFTRPFTLMVYTRKTLHANRGILGLVCEALLKIFKLLTSSGYKIDTCLALRKFILMGIGNW
jgi:hypothetical protein